MAAPATTTGTTAHGGAAPAHGGGFPPFQGETFASQLLWLAITFGFLYWLAAKVIVPRLGTILEDRANKIGNDLDEAAAMKAKAEEAGQAYEKSLAEARAMTGCRDPDRPGGRPSAGSPKGRWRARRRRTPRRDRARRRARGARPH